MEKFGELPSILQDFSYYQLKEILGMNLVDLLIEWMPVNELAISKSMLIKMILQIHGFNILKDKKVRKSVLQKLNEKKIETFRSIDKNYQLKSIPELINILCTKSWGNNKISKNLMIQLNVDPNFLNKNGYQEESIEKLIASDPFYELLDYQFIIKQRILNVINSDIVIPRLLVQMPTGTGKTKTAMHTLINYFVFDLKKEGLIIWLAHTNELLQQAYETFNTTWKHIGSGEINLYKLWGNNTPFDEYSSYKGIIIAGYQKMISLMKTNPDIFQKICENCSLVIVDEAHKSVADETRKFINELMQQKETYRSRALIGLTATPGRTMEEKENFELVKFYENRIISIDTKLIQQLKYSVHEMENISTEKDIIKYFQQQKILATLKREKLEYQGDFSEEEIQIIKIKIEANGYIDFSKKFLETIALNKRRNTAIVNKIETLHFDNIPTIIFACSVEHGRLLSSILNIKGIENAFIFGEMDSSVRLDLINKFKDRNNSLNIIINYEVLTTGFDSTNIKCVFITRPTQSIVLYSQMIGRGLRGVRMGGNEECLLIDIEDNLEKYLSESMAFQFFDTYWS
ncbi:DEAD/DEAH box helicase family protein [Paenibacillus sp. PsM32]|uniref:DEAD/DEAH box helicase n=1 Tax=Paenibacillus sp. PsM32 TaxID=3030536 RepID=UPI00263B4951|nr:DEAD/DEAH box helicase family protein [Paenibacillus sp. PsM32]MDN4617411.1 DEAD/DEAH box helicase family protein [Paenibacillus sp. PsM32]